MCSNKSLCGSHTGYGSPKGAAETASPAPPGDISTISQAKKALVATFRVPLEDIELTIHGYLV